MEQIIESNSENNYKLKIIGMGIVGVILSFFVGYFSSHYFNNGDSTSIILLVVFTILFLALFILQSIISQNTVTDNFLIIATTTALFLPLLNKFSWIILLILALVYLFFWIAQKRGRNKNENLMKIDIFQIGRYVLPWAITSLSLFISVAYLLVSNVDNGILSPKSIMSLIQPAQPLIKNLVIPDFSFTMTVPQLAKSLAQKEVQKEFVQDPAGAVNQLTNTTLEMIKEKAAQVDIFFTNNDNIGKILQNYISNQLNGLSKQMRQLIEIVLALLVFVSARSLGTIVGWFVLPVTYLIYELLKFVGFIKLGAEQRDKEIINL